MEYMQYVVSILAGLAAVIPLVIKLIEYVQKATKEKNWNKLVALVIDLIKCHPVFHFDLMQTAESKLEKGADKKEWVLAMVKSSADTINYDVNMDEVGALIDSLCDMSKVINAPKQTEIKTK